MPTKEFKQFIDSHIVQPGRILTHFVLSKKIKLHIPFEEREPFYHLYIDNILKCGFNDEYNSIVEKVYDKSAFNYFIDIDFDMKHFRANLLTPEQFAQFKAAFCEHMKTMISTTFGIENPNIVPSQRAAFKLHFNFPGLVVNFETAVALTTSLRNYMTVNYPIVLDNCHLWEKVIDTSVYNSTGLRMIWSNKGDVVVTQDLVNEHAKYFPGIECSNYYRLYMNGKAVQPNVDIVKMMSLHATTDPLPITNRFFLEQQDINPSDESCGVRPVYGFGDVPSDAVDAIKGHLADNLDCINGQKVKVEISKIRRLGRDGNIEVMLMPQSCPFVMREHRRTCDGNRPSNWVLITPFKTEFRCWKCTKQIHELNHIDNDIIEMLFDVNTHEIRARRALTRATDEAVGDFIFHLVKGTHAASHCGGKNYLWYKFEHKKHRWDKRDVIVEDIMRDNGPIQKMVRKYARMIHEHEQQLSKDIQLDDEETETSEDNQSEKKSKGPKQKSINDLCNALCKNLQSFSYVNNHVLPVLGLKLHNHLMRNGQTFQEQLDQNPKLLGFENGVFDFVSGEFREGKPSDMITLSTRTNYVAWKNQDPVVQKELLDFLSTLFPDSDERNYVLNELGCTLDGETTEQKFFFMTGYGANGKSTIVRLLNMSMGDYAGETNITLFTQTRPPANAPVPELICLRGKRFVTCSEPNSKDVLNFGTIKWLTGGDRITGRNLFEKQQSFYLQATFFCLCNDIPQINASDYGTWRRVRTILFSSQFVFGREPARPNEFKADETLDQKMKKWTHAFGSLLVHYCTKRTRYAIPPKFKETYDKLRHDNDIYTRFAHDCIVVRGPEECELLSVAEMFDVFVNWGKRFQVKGSRNVDLPLFYRNMQQILGPGIEYKTEDGCDMCGFYVEVSRAARM